MFNGFDSRLSTVIHNKTSKIFWYNSYESYDILFKNLNAIGFSGSNVDWLKSFQLGRKFLKNIKVSFATPAPLTFSALKVSIIKLLFLLYGCQWYARDCWGTSFITCRWILPCYPNQLNKDYANICHLFTYNNLLISE